MAGREGAGRGGARDASGGKGLGNGTGAGVAAGGLRSASASASVSVSGAASVQGVGKAKRTAKREELIWGAHFFFTHYFRPALTDAGKVGKLNRCKMLLVVDCLRHSRSRSEVNCAALCIFSSCQRSPLGMDL